MQLDYLEDCAYEDIRVRPGARLLPLQPRHELVIGDVLMPEGTSTSTAVRLGSVNGARLTSAAAFEPRHWLTDSDAPAIVAASIVEERKSCKFEPING